MLSFHQKHFYVSIIIFFVFFVCFFHFHRTLFHGLAGACMNPGSFFKLSFCAFTSCISFQIHNLSLCSESKKRIAVLSFSKLSFKVCSICLYILPQSSDFTKSSDMLNKNTLGVKKVRGQSEATCKQASATKIFDIRCQEVTYQKYF